MNRIKNLSWMAVFCLLAPIAGRAQLAQPGDPNPVSASAREVFGRLSPNIIAASEEMPADKFSFHPTAGQESFGKIVEHLAESNSMLCGLISDTPAPQTKLAESDSKDVLVGAMKASFELCKSSLEKLQDSKMGDAVTFYGGRKVPLARIVFELTGDLNDHYSQLASYLRANGMLPPTAQPRPKGRAKPAQEK